MFRECMSVKEDDMDIKVGFCTDKGLVKSLNQDALSIKVAYSGQGAIAFAVVCDGMGGLEQGELASKEVVLSFDEWFQSEFATMMLEGTRLEEYIYQQWVKRIECIEQHMKLHGNTHNVAMGTTLSALLIHNGQYYVCHVGDSRIYRINDEMEQLTTDHTWVAREMQRGRLTEEEAKKDTRRNVLLQCVGTLGKAKPQLLSGSIEKSTTFVLCSDGFVHMIAEQEMRTHFVPEKFKKKQDVEDTCKTLTHVAMERGEKDNITVIGIVVTI